MVNFRIIFSQEVLEIVEPARGKEADQTQIIVKDRLAADRVIVNSVLALAKKN